MAIMIPERPRELKKESLEDVMFSTLELLPDDFYVVHSFKYFFVNDSVQTEGETDFLIFAPKYGIICIEAKAGQVKYVNNTWCYANGNEMKHGGPYNQADNNKWNLIEMIKNSPLKDIKNRCKIHHAVWFPSITRKDLYTNRFPPEFDRNITMTMEDLENPLESIMNIFALKLANDIKTELSENDVKRVLREIICPEFQIFPSNSFETDLKKVTFHRLLNEQFALLNYLTEQRSAVINGAAGTGKTMIAIEKAMRHASKKERVLFLCYNVYLKDHLAETYKHEFIDFYTIAGFACKICGASEPDYIKAQEVIEDMYLTESFPYMHVIVDEGQDFGNEKIEETNILQVINDTVVDRDGNGTFYVFYDKLQLVQSNYIPKYISEADCKLTLYKNCRNTENIAITSLKPVATRTPKLIDGAIKGTPARIMFGSSEEDIVSKVSGVIDTLNRDGIDDIVILTCETEEKSVLSKLVKNGKFQKKIFTTCRKFKGLEADAIILVDVNRKTFMESNVLRFYVGASRARLKLEIVTDMSDDDCKEVLLNEMHYEKKVKIPKKDFAVALNAFPVV